jgi:hypothetical protein
MRKLGLLFFIFPAFCSGQVVFDFEKGDLSGWVQCRESSWDTSSLGAISGLTSLAHVFDNPESGHDQTGFRIDSLRPDLGRITWEFTIHHSYNPSSANNWGMFLVSDSEPCEMHPKGNASGYVIGVNYHGSDDLLKLWRTERGKGTVLIESQLNWQEAVGPDFPCQIKVVRDTNCQWIIYFRLDHGEDWIEAGDSIGEKQISPVYTGLYYEYSSRQDMKLRVDDIRLDGIFLQDTVPPSVDSINVTGSRELIMRFSEEIDFKGTIGTMNFLADNDIGQPVKVDYLSDL